MAPGLIALERRAANRVTPNLTPWQRLALLRPGREVVLINISAGGALVESSARLPPGTRTELQLSGAERRSVRGRIDRCRVTCLNPLCYEAAIVFDEALARLAPADVSSCFPAPAGSPGDGEPPTPGGGDRA